MKLKVIISNYREDCWYMHWAANKPYVGNDEFIDIQANYPKESYFCRYYLHKSGDKTLSTQILNDIDPILNVHIRRYVVTEIRNKFEKKWDNIWNDIIKEYDNTNSFNISYNEKTTDSLNSNTVVDSTENNKTDSSDRTVSSDEENINSIYAFNNGNEVPRDKNKTHSENENVSTEQNNSTNNRNETYTRENPKTREYSRTGNIGNKSLTQLLKEDIEYRKIQMWDIMCEDLDTIFTRSIYSID